MGDGVLLLQIIKKVYLWMKKYRNHGMINRDEIEFVSQLPNAAF